MSELEQYDEAWVHERYIRKDHKAIEQARIDGHLAEMLGQPIPVKIEEGEGQPDSETLKTLFRERRYEDIEKLKNAGRFDRLLGIER